MKTLDKIREWAESDSSYLSRSTDYARGYSDGIIMAKDIVNALLNERESEKENDGCGK